LELRYTYEIGKKYYVGYLDNYPQHPTQGADIRELETNLLDIYQMIQNGDLETAEVKKHGILELAL
jgi:hypothetical protein